MKKLFAAFDGLPWAFMLIAAIVGCAAAVWAEPPGTLTTLHAIHSLSHAQAAMEPPVAFEATVTYRRAAETTLFVQDGDVGIYVWADASIHMAPGDRVLVRGKANDSFRPIVIADSVTVLRHVGLPSPVPATFDELMHSQVDCVFVTIRAKIRSADLSVNSNRNDIHMTLLVDGGTIDTYVNSDDASAPNELLDAEVEISGVAGAKLDGKMQQTGIGLAVPSLANIKIVKHTGVSPWSLPVSQMDQIVTNNYRVNDLSQRVRVHGTITYYHAGSALVLQSGSKSLWIQTVYEKPLRIGQEADVIGFPGVRDGFLALDGGEIQESQGYGPIAPKLVTVSDLAASRHIFELVSIEGQVVTEVQESSQDEYVLTANGQVFSAIYRHQTVGGIQTLPMNHVQPGSRVRVSGICVLDHSSPYRVDVPFDMLIRAPEDISVIAPPSLLTVRNLGILVGLLIFVLLVLGTRAWFVEHRARQQTAASAYMERRRSRILEDINGTRPLAEIIEEITELVSFRLKGAPCWCQIAGGAQLGNWVKDLPGMRVVQQEIPSRSGPPLGELFVAFDPLTAPSIAETEALSLAAALASLAIETRRLYSDLLRRSEFDLLTDIHNRFSLDKCLDAQIEEARKNASVFGLIYIDLDHFKQVNDLHGHHVGDLYLQEVASRMKRQLRAHDSLARLGGDEFAALVPIVRSRAEVQEIALRLERSFDEPYPIEGAVLHPAASIGIALYPEDAITKDGLLNAADAAMYVAKNRKRQVEEMISQLHDRPRRS
ncbi:MAG: GGDEF domain-containing protein [Terracidiphilus sp.]